MDSIKQLLRRDEDSGHDIYGPDTGILLYAFFGLILVGSVLSLSLMCLRRKRIAQRQAFLPHYHGHSHRRSASVTNLPNLGPNESVYVYDDKMNLIVNSSSTRSAQVPQIRVTFPDDEDSNGHGRSGRVVVVHVTETGSVGMSPLHQEPAPPYQTADAERFQSLDLDRMGGLREKQPLQQRYS